ncbi:NAD(P)/FAD-dependent oxidoreductase [Bradyrhizobium sp.]|uniref:NAD(P)/FAD-dependent oxidoreductase n=1 Tax=Bradyrhizobium sp. TaxID=376 RepID=UPI001D6A67F1|nr:FAD-dependent oxidoreductase [Bradyrhizobium sp.]MBV8700688.1 FAD-dependent oxidoreductase [Bradyrhizobium sp.]MBV8921714.1 FAD-dependent oxidoreductase [Bradyrhizobium sp.]MBV9979535.1 FAD-dependent oxidoreductase [Bradyrhizobium sp.]
MAAASIKTEIAIVGAGIIALAVAYRLAAAGRDVLVVDPNDVGSGASYGNAGAIAPYGCAPIGNPDVLRNLPYLLLGSESPFAMRPAALPSLLPWLSRFLWQSTPMRARRNGHAIHSLLKDAAQAWHHLAAQAGVSDLIHNEGCLYIYREKAPAKDWASRLRDDLGVKQEWLTSDEVAKLEPALPHMAGGLFFPDAAHIVDPPALTRRLAMAARSHGVSFQRARVERIEPQGSDRFRLACADVAIAANKVVLAAGAWSRTLARQVGDEVPLDTERGYHLEFAMDVCPITRPVSPIDLGFYVTPMAGRLRVAGTVELGGLHAPLNPHRTALLERGVRKLFPDLGAPQSHWLGFRPSLPDSLPVIGPSRRHPGLIHAFGHGHLGMTLAAVTSVTVAGLLEGGNGAWDLSPFRVDRFR